MTPYPTEQGFYVRDTNGWERIRGVPLDHLYGKKAWKWAVLRRDFCYVDKHGGVHVAYIGFPFNGLSIPRLLWRVCGHPWGINLAAGVIHDILRAMAHSLPPGERRDELCLHGDMLFAEMLEFIGNCKVVERAWYRAVRLGSWQTRNKPQTPDYATDLQAYYKCVGLDEDIYDWVWERVVRHADDAG